MFENITWFDPAEVVTLFVNLKTHYNNRNSILVTVNGRMVAISLDMTRSLSERGEMPYLTYLPCVGVVK